VSARRAPRPASILLIEDNPGDVVLLQEALRAAGARHAVTVVPDGVDALAYLRREGRWSDVKPPDLVLLDLKLPRLDGSEVLAEIRRDPLVRAVPVVVFSSSSTEADVKLAYELGANCYVVKPADLDQYLEAVRTIEDFWLRMVLLPR
jgi:CheY-like chemotaxis protein